MKQNKKFESSEILKKSFLQLKQQDQFSLRKWAELVGISAPTLNLILNSKRLVPKKHLFKLAESLDFDTLSRERLQNAHQWDWLISKGLSPSATKSKEAFDDAELEEITENDEVLLKSWLHLALLEFSTCSNFREDPGFLAQQFKVTIPDVKRALADLIQAGFLVREGSDLKKKNRKLRIPTKRSRELVRNFHLQMLKEAMKHLQSATPQEVFEKRLISGYTVAVNERHIKKVRSMLEKSMLEACSQLIEGDCQSVYQVQIQFFPLTKGSSES